MRYYDRNCLKIQRNTNTNRQLYKNVYNDIAIMPNARAVRKGIPDLNPPDIALETNRDH